MISGLEVKVKVMLASKRRRCMPETDIVGWSVP
jgi:hypothetical protein